MTDHGHALDLAAAALDWDLTAAEQDEMSAHLASCRSCRHAVAIQQDQHTALRATTYADSPARVRRAVLRAAKGDLRGRRQPPWTLLAAAALIALTVLGGAVGAYLLDRARDATSIEFSARPPASPMTVAQREALRWAALPEAADVFRDATIGSVVHGRTGFVALGQARSTLTTLVWVSPDGVSWESVPQPGDAFGGGIPTHVVTGGPGYVAIGWDISVEGGTRRSAWTSPDGRAWQPSSDPSGRFGQVDILGMAGGDGIVAVLASESEGSVPVMLLSSDGIVWERLSAPAQGVTGIALGNPGLVAFGLERDLAKAWYSADGRSWAPAPAEPGVGGEVLTGLRLERVVGSGSHLLAQGRSNSGDRFLWSSLDGRRWTAIPEGATPAENAIVAGGRGAFFAYVVPATSDAPVVAWTSIDGETWIALANSAPASAPASAAVDVNHVLPTDQGWVLFGYETANATVVAWTIR